MVLELVTSDALNLVVNTVLQYTGVLTSVFIEKINASDKAQNKPKNTKMQLLPVFELTSTHTKNFRKNFLRIGSFEFLVAKSFFLLHSYENQPKYILPPVYYKNRTRSVYAIIMTLTI